MLSNGLIFTVLVLFVFAQELVRSSKKMLITISMAKLLEYVGGESYNYKQLLDSAFA